MTEIKKGVKINGVKPEMVLGIIIIQSVFDKHGKTLVITEVTGGKHGYGSLHYSGNAVDIRTRDFTLEETNIIANDLREALRENFDVVVENTHIHAEYQPK